MTSAFRPPRVGRYTVLTDFQASGASVRVFELGQATGAVEAHVHQRSAQIYVALEGQVVIVREGHETTITPYEALEVPAGQVHAARAAGGRAVVMNVSVPPLAADDQMPATPLWEQPAQG
ncbi:MAG: cupin domain-containing protein [Dehalococcoidia bacterium]|nr:cupin domain-containing protein [Dehalococcoidia bacterium]